MAYGSAFGNGIDWSQAGAVQDTWYEITDTGIDDGVESSVTNADGVMTIGTNGTYLITYSVGMFCDHRRVEVGLLVNADVSTNGRSFMLATAYGDTVSGAAILPLLQNDTVKVVIRTIDGGLPTITVDTINIAIATVS